MQKLDVFKCEICGNIVELLHVGGGDLVCCGEPMKLLEEKSADSATEKHLPDTWRTHPLFLQVRPRHALFLHRPTGRQQQPQLDLSPHCLLTQRPAGA
jgi:desulfoferrodoxin-like iron-binding protein